MKKRDHNRHESSDCGIQSVRNVVFVLAAVPGLFAAQSVLAQAQDKGDAADDNQDLKALVCPQNYFEIGLLKASDADAPKFGEYNGLAQNGSGFYGLGGFSFQGGDGYCQQGGTRRWQVTGDNLGTSSRSLGASIGDQGQWSFGLSYDQLRHYTTTGYETPFLGSMGGNLFTLPPNYGFIDSGSAAGSQGLPGPGGANQLTPAQIADYRDKNVYNQRQTLALGTTYYINNQWSIKFDVKHLDMSGAKLISAPSDSYPIPSATSTNAQTLVQLMNPTESETDTFNVVLNWMGNKGYANGEYYASLYHDDYRGISWQVPFRTAATQDGSGYQLDSMGLPPSNQYQQLRFGGGYFFSPTTKLVGTASIAYNTQNASFDGTYTTPGVMLSMPVNSLQGKVVTTHADARLTHQFTSSLNLNAGFRFDERENNTPSYEYEFYTLRNQGSADEVLNIPMSYRKAFAYADLDFRLTSDQRLHLGLERENVDRWCNNAITNPEDGTYVGSDCIQSPHSGDTRANVNYKLSLLDDLSFNVGYTYSDRHSTINPVFYNPVGYDADGFVAFFQASRRENLFKIGLNWQLTEKLSLGIDGKHTRDDYYDNSLGVQSGQSSSANFDIEYQFSDDMQFSAYASWQRFAYDTISCSTAACTGTAFDWGTGMGDRTSSFGVNAKQKALRGKLQFVEDLSLDMGNSQYDNWSNAAAPAVGSTGSPGNITSRLLQFRVAGTYTLDMKSSVSVGYMLQRLHSNDYYYNALMLGYTPTTLLATGQTSPNYSQNVVFVNYRYAF